MTIIDNDPAPIDVRGTIGDKIEFTLTFTEDGTPTDYSSHAINAAVKTAAGGLVLSLTVDDANAANGVIGITLEQEESDQLENTNDWDLQVDDGTGPQTIAAGQFIMRNQVAT